MPLIRPSKVAECNRLNERLASSQQQLADLQSLREVDTLDMETRQVLLLMIWHWSGGLCSNGICCYSCMLFQISDLRSQVADLTLRLGQERARADREADVAERLRDDVAVAKLQEQQAALRQTGMVERNEKLQGEVLALQGKLQVVELQFGEQQKLMSLQQMQQQQHQQQHQHHSDELNSLRMQRDSWEAEARHSKSVVSELASANARLQVRRALTRLIMIATRLSQ